MGRDYYSTKRTADSCRKIDIHWLHNHGYEFKDIVYQGGTLTWTTGYEETKNSIGIAVRCDITKRSLELNYTVTDGYTGKKRPISYRVPLDTTLCNFSGYRYWFRCPLYKNGEHCNRRVATLYFVGDYFGCRHCYNLTYKSRNENRKNALYYLFNIFDRGEKIDNLKASLKRRYYRGSPTRKYRKILDFEARYDKSKYMQKMYDGLNATKKVEVL